MAENTNRRKIKLVKMLEILRQDTDEDHPITTSELCSRLADEGIPCDRKVLYQDIALLNEEGFEIMTVQKGHNKAYYVADRSFSIPELKILIDAVQAASFITERKTKDLIDRIAALGGSHQAEILKNNLVCFNSRKHTNESIYYNVGFLEEAIQKKQKASFFYFDLNEYGERVYRGNKKRYITEPLGLVFNSDNYYLICYDKRNKDMKATYRVDRMDYVTTEDAPFSKEAIRYSKSYDISDYTKETFTMFAGPEEIVILEFDESLANSVFDKFGEGTVMNRREGGLIRTSVKVQISHSFYAWISRFGNRMKIVEPDIVRRDYDCFLGI